MKSTCSGILHIVTNNAYTGHRIRENDLLYGIASTLEWNGQKWSGSGNPIEQRGVELEYILNNFLLPRTIWTRSLDLKTREFLSAPSVIQI